MIAKFAIGQECILKPMATPSQPEYRYGIPKWYFGRTVKVVQVFDREVLGDYDCREYKVRTDIDPTDWHYGDPPTTAWYVYEPMLEPAGGPW